MRRFISPIAFLSLICGTVGLPVRAQDAVGAYKLYTQRQYGASVDAFEKIIAKAPPEARLYYYAGLANREAGRTARARQIFDYVITNFATAPEASLAKAAAAFLPEGGTSPVSGTTGSVQAPNSGRIPYQVRIPKSAAATAATVDNIVNPEDKSKDESNSIVSLFKRPHKKGDFVFTVDEISREGANGIDQTNYPNCWFESAMSALAQLPKGQRMLARMITYGEGASFIVRFPGDGKEYKITEDELEDSGVNCTAHWASLLDYAERLKFPNNHGAEGADGEQSRLANGLGCITGCPAQMIYPPQSNIDELRSFIYGAVSSRNPITCGTAGRNSRVYAPIIEGHAYTIIGFDPSHNMVLIRNPHGHKSRTFTLADDPNHLRFEQLEDGCFKMSLDLFHDAFGSVCRSFI